jgi:hypothetical protein
MGLQQIQKLLHSKGNNDQHEETVYTMGENLPSDRGLISRAYKELKTERQMIQLISGQMH